MWRKGNPNVIEEGKLENYYAKWDGIFSEN